MDPLVESTEAAKSIERELLSEAPEIGREAAKKLSLIFVHLGKPLMKEIFIASEKNRNSYELAMEDRLLYGPAYDHDRGRFTQILSEASLTIDAENFQWLLKFLGYGVDESVGGPVYGAMNNEKRETLRKIEKWLSK